MAVELVRRELVCAAAFEADGFASLADCRDACATLWGLAIEIEELRSVVESLRTAGKLTKDANGYALTETARDELQAVVESSKRIEATALAEWETKVQVIGSELGQDDMEFLRADLLIWLQRIIIHYGVESALILYPEEERARQFFHDVQELGFDFLPGRSSALMSVRPTALYLFIREPTPTQRGFIANLMTTAYMAAIFTLDPEAQRLVQAVTSGQRIYLDTNMLYSALNLNGPHAYLSAKRVLDMTRQLGYELAVTPWTVAEMKESVRHCREELARTSLPPRALAEIAADASGEGSFISAYWRKYKETGVLPKDFCDLHEQIEGLVEKLGIALRSEGCLDIDRRRETIREHISLISRVRGGESKSTRIKEHDIKHRLLVEKLRGDHNRKFSSAGYWFLTRDGVLIPYGLADRPAGALPFAVSLTAWTQIVRGFTPRTENYDQTLVDLLDTPSLRPRGVISPQTIAEILGRIDLLVSDSTEEIATRVMFDSAAMVEIEAESGMARTTRIEALVAEKSREMERQLADTQKQLEDERNARAEIEAEAVRTGREIVHHRSRLDTEREDHERVLSELAGRADRERSAAEEQIAAANARATALERERQEENEDMERRGRLRRRRAAAVLLILLGGALIAIPTAIGWIVGGWSLVGLIFTGGLVVGLGVAIGIHRQAARRFFVIGAAVIGVLTGIHEIVAPSGRNATGQVQRAPQGPK